MFLVALTKHHMEVIYGCMQMMLKCITYPLGLIGMVFIINSPFKMPYTKYVLNRGFCPFYFITHESICITHGNGTTISYTAIGTQITRVYNF